MCSLFGGVLGKLFSDRNFFFHRLFSHSHVSSFLLLCSFSPYVVGIKNLEKKYLTSWIQIKNLFIQSVYFFELTLSLCLVCVCVGIYHIYITFFTRFSQKRKIEVKQNKHGFIFMRSYNKTRLEKCLWGRESGGFLSFTKVPPSLRSITAYCSKKYTLPRDVLLKNKDFFYKINFYFKSGLVLLYQTSFTIFFLLLSKAIPNVECAFL